MTDRAMAALVLGAQGETYIFNLFQRAQRSPVYAPPGDIRLDDGAGISIEVKASLPNAGRGRFQFCLYKEGHTDARKSDVTILLAYPTRAHRPVLLAIPRARLNGAKSIKLPGDLGNYHGKWSWFFGLSKATAELQGSIER